MDRQALIYVAGGRTMIGAAILRELEGQGFHNLLGYPGQEPHLADGHQVREFFHRYRPEYVFFAAGRSGGIRANQKYPAELMLDNLLAECHVIDAAYRYQVKKLLYLASSCSYPRLCPQPMKVEALMSGPLEPTNEAYATAKLAGIKLCQAYRQQYSTNFISVIPANAFGPQDDFSPDDSHVIAALIRRVHEAVTLGLPSIRIWGTGNPRREFIYTADLANACVFIMEQYEDPEPVNLGSGTDLSIRELAELIKEISGYTGELYFDANCPDGMPLKMLDSSPLSAMGWRPAHSLEKALAETYSWYQQANIQ